MRVHGFAHALAVNFAARIAVAIDNVYLLSML